MDKDELFMKIDNIISMGITYEQLFKEIEHWLPGDDLEDFINDFKRLYNIEE